VLHWDYDSLYPLNSITSCSYSKSYHFTFAEVSGADCGSPWNMMSGEEAKLLDYSFHYSEDAPGNLLSTVIVSIVFSALSMTISVLSGT